ncbi:MAG TPA: hypothetical protein VJS65_04925 [Verrucomicrobiae bacterium]|nr:hypothetical protein [Verrucomicrobiae bacterium]
MALNEGHLFQTHVDNRSRHPARFWPAAALYGVGALAGGLWGRTYYLVDPIAIIGHVSFSDLRHGGAIGGAVCGAALAALLRNSTSSWRTGWLAPLLTLVTLAALGYLLCVQGAAMGGITLGTLALPWVLSLGWRKLRPDSEFLIR